MPYPRALCVYCSSSSAAPASYHALAEAVGARLAHEGIELVYGGATVGLMGAVANAVLEAGGKVTGVIPVQLDQREIMHRGLTDLVVTDNMHDRKRIMFERSAGFVALPGGFGTLEELVEMITWKQLRMHAYPVVALNHEGYYDALRAWIDRAAELRMIAGSNVDLVHFAPTVEACFAYLEAYESPHVPPVGEWF